MEVFKFLRNKAVRLLTYQKKDTGMKRAKKREGASRISGS